MSAKAPLYKIITDALIKDIRTGVYQLGDQLPGHTRLAREKGVSLITSNRALKELERLGYASRRSREGTFVCPRVQRILVPASTKDNRESPQLFEYLDGILVEANQRKIEVAVMPFESDVFASVEALHSGNFHGIIQLGASSPHFPAAVLQRSGLPWLCVGVEEGLGHYFVNEDRRAAAFEIVQLMRQAGRQRIGFLGRLNFPNHRLCRDGYLEALADTNLGSSLVRDVHTPTILPVAEELAPKVDGLIVAGGGIMSCMALAYLRGQQNTMPIGVFDESADIEEFRDQVYFAEMDHVESGRHAVRMLTDIVGAGDEVVTHARLPCKVTLPRES